MPKVSSPMERRDRRPARNIENVVGYTEGSDVTVKGWLPANVDSTWRPIGTCRLETREKMGLADRTRRTHGVEQTWWTWGENCP